MRIAIIVTCLILSFATFPKAKEHILSDPASSSPIALYHYDKGYLNMKISICEGIDDCVEIITEGGPTYRIYGCGKLDKLEWKELNPNEETLSSDTWLDTTGYTTLKLSDSASISGSASISACTESKVYAELYDVPYCGD